MITFRKDLPVILNYRKKHPEKRYSPATIAGSILVPLLVILFFIGSFDIVASIIGEYASRRNGYIFLSIIFYPVVLPFYFAAVVIIDKIKKKYIIPNSNRL